MMPPLSSLPLLVTPYNGLGDQMLDLICACVMGKILGVSVHVLWGSRPINNCSRGNCVYDYEFAGLDVTIHNAKQHRRLTGRFRVVKNVNSSASTCPHNVLHWLQKHGYSFSLRQLFDMYVDVAKGIQFPKHIHDVFSPPADTVAIHVRGTDKVNFSSTITVSQVEYSAIWDSVLKHIDEKTTTTNFFVCSEDKDAARRMQNDIKARKPDAVFFESDGAVLTDLFVMSRCAAILQCTNYSTFSLLAAFLGGRPDKLVNFQMHKPTLLYGWLPEVHPSLTMQSLMPWAGFDLDDQIFLDQL